MTGGLTTLQARRSARPWVLWGLWVALSAAIAIAVVNLGWSGIVQRLSSVSLPWVAAAIAANFAILPVWAAEWRLLVPAAFRVGYRRMFEIVAITASVLNAVPFFAGEASAVGLLITRGALTPSAAASVLALDQLLVALAKLTTLAAAAVLVSLPVWLRTGVLSLVVGFSILLAVLLLLAHSWQRLQRWLAHPASRVRRVIARIAAWGQHLDALRVPRRALGAVVLALSKKALEVVAVIATQLAFGLEPSFAIALLVIAALAITTLLPIAPANLGVYEATVFAAYRYAGVPAETAAGLAFVQHACFLLPSILTGYGLATLKQLRRQSRELQQ